MTAAIIMMRSLLLSTLLCFALTSAAAFAQVGGPILGYVPEGDTVRPMYGLPAAGAIGAQIAEGGWARVAISPTQNFVLATSADTGGVLLVNLVKPSVTGVSGAAPNPDILAISPSGTSAVLWFPSNFQMQVVTGLPDSPSVRTVDASFLNASPLSIAVSDDGQWAVGLFSAGVYAFGPSVMPLQTDPGVIALSFFHNSHNLALATSARATMWTDVGGANQPSILYDYSAQSLSPRALGVSFDNQLAVVADSTGKLVNINVASRAANTVDCACSPTGLYSLGGSVFRLNGTGRAGATKTGHTEDLKVFDAAAGAVWIVPPALSEVKGARQ
jgi:DNA-binding beta-propeller fold protein YncE